MKDLPGLIPESTIKQAESYIKEHPPGNTRPEIEKRERMSKFIDEFSRTLSVGVSLKVANISRSTLNIWKKTDPNFCREMNEVICQVYEELVPVLLTRARGYVKANPDTMSGYDEDGEGTVIRYNSDSKLMAYILDRILPPVEKLPSVPCEVTINYKNLVGEQTSLSIEHIPEDLD